MHEKIGVSLPTGLTFGLAPVSSDIFGDKIRKNVSSDTPRLSQNLVVLLWNKMSGYIREKFMNAFMSKEWDGEFIRKSFLELCQE